MENQFSNSQEFETLAFVNQTKTAMLIELIDFAAEHDSQLTQDTLFGVGDALREIKGAFEKIHSVATGDEQPKA